MKKTKENDLTKNNLKGCVKSVKENTYKATEKSGKVIKNKIYYDGTNNIYEVFDTKGYIIESAIFSSESVFLKGNCKYDIEYNIIEYDIYTSDGSLLFKHSHEYDVIGNIKEESIYSVDDCLLCKYFYKYDTKGNKIESICYDDNGSLVFKYTHRYDFKGNEIEWIRFNSDESFDGRFTYKYNAEGYETERNWYNSDGSLYEKNIFKYDPAQNENWVKKIEFLIENDFEIPETITERKIQYY